MTKRNDSRRRIFVGTHEGVCVANTSVGGATWSLGNIMLLANAAARLSVSSVESERVYLAAYEAGLYKTDDSGDTWDHLTSYPTDYTHSVLVHPEQPGVLFVGSEPAGIFRSDDGGESWSECTGFQHANHSNHSNQSAFHGDRLSHVRELRVVPGDSITMFAGVEVGGIIKSTDGGESWKLINDGVERRYTLRISAAPHDASLVLVAVSTNARRDNPQFYRSVNGGTHWNLIDSVGQGENPEDMAVAIDWDPAIRNRVYADTDGGKIYRGDDGGQRWEAL